MVLVRVLGITIADIPTIDAIVDRCETIDALRAADPAQQSGTPEGNGTTP